MMEDNRKKQFTNYAKYTGIGFQMLAIIGVFTFIGYKIDEKRNGQNHLFTALFGVLGVAASLYQVIRSLSKDK